MVAIIRQVLDQTRVRLQISSHESQWHHPRSAVPAFTGSAKQHVTLKTDLQADLPPVAGDPRALHGLLFNFAANAVQAMPIRWGIDYSDARRLQYGASWDRHRE